jgi:hypothetical protein
VGPLIAGYLLARGVETDAQMGGMALFTAASAGLIALGLRRFAGGATRA